MELCADCGNELRDFDVSARFVSFVLRNSEVVKLRVWDGAFAKCVLLSLILVGFEWLGQFSFCIRSGSW